MLSVCTSALLTVHSGMTLRQLFCIVSGNSFRRNVMKVKMPRSNSGLANLVVCICKPGTWEAEAGEWVWISKRWKARPCLKTIQNKKGWGYPQGHSVPWAQLLMVCWLQSLFSMNSMPCAFEQLCTLLLAVRLAPVYNHLWIKLEWSWEDLPLPPSPPTTQLSPLSRPYIMLTLNKGRQAQAQAQPEADSKWKRLRVQLRMMNQYIKKYN